MCDARSTHHAAELLLVLLLLEIIVAECCHGLLQLLKVTVAIADQLLWQTHSQSLGQRAQRSSQWHIRFATLRFSGKKSCL